MAWLTDLFHPGSVANAVLILSLVAAAGLALGSIRIAGVGLSVAGVLFAGILFGHYHLTINDQMLEFARNFGLILFLYTIGMQVGPGFLSSLRRQGLVLNLLAAGIVVLGALLTVALIYYAHIQMPVAIGLFCGATTSTPSLAAGQQALQGLPGVPPATVALPALGYAVAYPFGVVGIILIILLIRWGFHIDIQQEAQTLKQLHEAERAHARLARLNLLVTNAALDGAPLRNVPYWSENGIVISRVRHAEQLQIAQPEMSLHLGDILLAVGPQANLEEFRTIIGEESPVDLTAIPSEITTRQLLVTRRRVLGKSVEELSILERYGVVITRIGRAGVEFTPQANGKLQFGDTVLAVGDPQALEQVAMELGNSPKQLGHTEVIPIFVGIALGVILGSVPIAIPGIPAPIRMGLAGGPLIVAILLSYIGRIGPLIWYMPASANFAFREVGIVLFLASVGLKAGEGFVQALSGGNGLYWMAMAALVTVIPLITMALIGQIVLKVNFLTLCGLLTGSMTDTTALSFATNYTGGSEAPLVAYATVYPLTLILRVLLVQLIVLIAH